MECKREENKKNCTCGATNCPRHGICCECVAYHRSKGQLPSCLRAVAKEIYTDSK